MIGIGPDTTTLAWVALISASVALNVVLFRLWWKEKSVREELDKVISEEK